MGTEFSFAGLVTAATVVLIHEEPASPCNPFVDRGSREGLGGHRGGVRIDRNRNRVWHPWLRQSTIMISWLLSS